MRLGKRRHQPDQRPDPSPWGRRAAERRITLPMLGPRGKSHGGGEAERASVAVLSVRAAEGCVARRSGVGGCGIDLGSVQLAHALGTIRIHERVAMLVARG